jgi:carboxymethylenebutenolidase
MEQTKPTVPPEAIQAYNLYIHGEIDRRSFVNRVTKVATSSLAAAAIVDQLMPNYAAAQQVSPTDTRLKTERQRHDQGLPRATVQRREQQAPSYPGRSREPWTEPAHRRRGASSGARELHGVRPRRAHLRRWIPG